jgi:hypothetical protein
LPIATAADRGAAAGAKIPGQMSRNVKPLANKTGAFYQAIQAGAPQATDPANMSGAQLTQALNTGNFGGADPAEILQAFLTPKKVPWAASNPNIMGSRAKMVTLGAKQGALGDTLGQANTLVSKAKAQGLGPAGPILQNLSQASGQQAANQAGMDLTGSALKQASSNMAPAMARNLGSPATLDADAIGLDAISKMGARPQIPIVSPLWRLLAKLGGQAPKQTPDIAQVNLRGGPRAAQTASALLGDKAIKPLSDSAGWSGANAMTITDLLAALSQNRSKK